jgi:fucose 4-O-acetylase-like acetyltransferase
MANKKREVWLDAAKGFGMILVVLGHAYDPHDIITYIYWFHMPAFFMFSGYVCKPIQEWSQLGDLIKKRAKQLLLPYFCYLGAFTVLRYIYELWKGNTSLAWYGQDSWNLIIGGRFITGYYGVFWFITCLFVTQIVFVVLLLSFKTMKARFTAIGILYAAAHIEAYFVNMMDGSQPSLNVWIPWNLDVVMLAIFYYSIGYFAKPFLKKIPLWITTASTAFTLLFMILYQMELLDYHLSLKFLRYDSPLLDIVIPLTMTIAYCGFFQTVSLAKLTPALIFINKKSMPIMYMHIGANKLLLQYADYGNALYTIVGITVPLLVVTLVFHNIERVQNWAVNAGSYRYFWDMRQRMHLYQRPTRKYSKA